MTKGQKTIYKHTHKSKDRVTWTPFMSAVMWETQLLALSRCLSSLLGFCGVVLHIFFVFVSCYLFCFSSLCLVCPKLPVYLDYPFVISLRYSPTFIEVLFIWNAHRYWVMINHHKISCYISKMFYKGSKYRIFIY